MIKKLTQILNKILAIIGVILLAPVEILLFILIVIFMKTTERSFKFLKKIGYKYKRKNGFVYYTKGIITFKIKQDISYMVKYGEEEYIDFHNFKVGSLYEKKVLHEKLIEYENAHPVDKQRGEVDTLTVFSEYLKRHIKDFEKLADFYASKIVD